MTGGKESVLAVYEACPHGVVEVHVCLQGLGEPDTLGFYVRLEACLLGLVPCTAVDNGSCVCPGVPQQVAVDLYGIHDKGFIL